MGEIKIIHSDVYAGLKYLPDNSIHAAVTSPPYWGQRDYGFDGQIGKEDRYQDYIGKLVTIFGVLRDKLVDRGVFFLNVGDKYIAKYGKSPLGFIPYKLAYFMKKDGWILNDILIWYKPNHMPSSIRNRFSNTYEPVFVFSKSDDNYYDEYVSLNPNQSKILKINVQPTPYKHMAVYPERLVEVLLSMLNLPYGAIVLDPFAGSGTTGKAVITLNNRLDGKNLSCLMIERCDEYIQIMLERCNIRKENIISLPFIEYQASEIIEDKISFIALDTFTDIEIPDERGFVKIVSTKDEYYSILNSLSNPVMKKKIRPDALIFIGCKIFDIDVIYKTSLLNNCGWIVRNMLIINNKNRVFPVFMIVDDNKKYEYLFNLENITIPHMNNNKINWKERNFVGYNVVDKLHKKKKNGVVLNILENYPNGFPKWAKVQWNDGTITKEFVIYDDNITPNVKFICRNCNGMLTHYFDPIRSVECPNCHTMLWEDTYPMIKEDEAILKEFAINKHHRPEDIALPEIDITIPKRRTNNYNGKFKDAKKINLGASPGARSSVQEEYFSVRRLYKVEQKMICEYLELKRKEKGLSKKAIAERFPKEYIHTVGHWFRKDFGGSIPTPEDWLLLEKILDLDDDFTNYVLRTGLKLQIVKASSNGKNPGDYLEIEENNVIEVLTNAFR
ncbi:MAG: site-specific DNA-methyltransferase [Thermoplasmata archaeon]